jgi:hypothetical protein
MHEIIETLNELLDSVKALNNKVDILLARNPSLPADGISSEEEEEDW